MKVSICAQVTYVYECEIPDETDSIDLLLECDIADPVYGKLCKLLSENHLNFDGEIISIQDDETGEILYAN